MEITITIKLDGSEIVNLKTEKTERKPDKQSQYARFYDETCEYWEKDATNNYMFLRTQQVYANDLLRSRGYVFLNEVYDMLGMVRTKAGQIVGWVYDKENPVGDNYVDFGLTQGKSSSMEHIESFNKAILLDFNVDGVILDKI